MSQPEPTRARTKSAAMLVAVDSALVAIHLIGFADERYDILRYVENRFGSQEPLSAVTPCQEATLVHGGDVPNEAVSDIADPLLQRQPIHSAIVRSGFSPFGSPAYAYQGCERSALSQVINASGGNAHRRLGSLALGWEQRALSEAGPGSTVHGTPPAAYEKNSPTAGCGYPPPLSLKEWIDGCLARSVNSPAAERWFCKISDSEGDISGCE